MQELLSIDLFKGIKETELPKVLRCLSGNIRDYAKNQFILLTGGKMPDAGIVLAGKVQISKTDSFGNRVMLAELGPKAFFSLKLSGAGHDDMPTNVMTLADSSILFLNCQHILNAPDNCLYHSKLADNLLKIVTAENMSLSRKITMLSRRTIREKILTCLLIESQKADNFKFTLPFNRQELADYLCVDRSALSRELCRLRDEGRINFRGKLFEILE